MVLPHDSSSRSSYGFTHDSARVPHQKGALAWSHCRSMPIPARLSPSAAAMRKVKASAYASMPLLEHGHEPHAEHEPAGGPPGVAGLWQQRQQQLAGQVAPRLSGTDAAGACRRTQPFSCVRP